MEYWLEIIGGTIGGVLIVWFLLALFAVGWLAIRVLKMRGWPPLG